MIETEKATHEADLPHTYRQNAGNPGLRCNVCGHGERYDLHHVQTQVAGEEGGGEVVVQKGS